MTIRNEDIHHLFRLLMRLGIQARQDWLDEVAKDREGVYTLWAQSLSHAGMTREDLPQAATKYAAKAKWWPTPGDLADALGVTPKDEAANAMAWVLALSPWLRRNCGSRWPRAAEELSMVGVFMKTPGDPVPSVDGRFQFAGVAAALDAVGGWAAVRECPAVGQFGRREWEEKFRAGYGGG